MKKIIFTTMLSLSIFLLSAQETVSSAGEDLNNTDTKINFTVGEPVISTYQINGNTILSGYQQPTLKVDEIDGIKETEHWNVNVFPNPSTNYIQIEWNKDVNESLEYQLYSIGGKIIKTGKENQGFRLDVAELAAGNYFLILENHSNKKQTYKIQKTK